MLTNKRDIKSPVGTKLSCKSWAAEEAPYRMLHNNLDRDVAENPDALPDALVVYGGIGKAARTWKDFDLICSSLESLNEDQTLLVQSGKPVGVFQLTGKWILTGGLGGMGGAQPLAAVMAGACCLAVECNPESIDFRLRTRYVDERADTLDEALALIDKWTAAGEAKSVGLLGNAAEIFPELVKRGVRPDMVTDQTSAHDRLRVHEGASSGDARFLEYGCSHIGLWE